MCILHSPLGRSYLKYENPSMTSLLLKSTVLNCNIRFHWKKFGLPCLMHIDENEILPVK